MNRLELLEKLNQILLEERPELKKQAEQFEKNEVDQRRLLRSLMNIRNPEPLSEEYLNLEAELLEKEKEQADIVDVMSLEEIKPKLSLYQGDITKLKSDAIVNAANATLLGCFIPEHNCIDNAIHSAAGLELRDECNKIMKEKNAPEKTGGAEITSGYHLPAKHVIHTVGPIVEGAKPTAENREDLRSSYRSSLELAEENDLESIVFCCISTGVFGYPNMEAAELAVETVEDYLEEHPESSIKRVVFNTFKDIDTEIYEQLLENN